MQAGLRIMNRFFCMPLLLSCCFIDASERVQTSRIADIGKALRNNFNKKRFVIAHLHIAGSMRRELGLTSSLSRDKSEGNHFTLSVIQPCAGIVVPEAVAGQPAVDMPALFRAG